MKKTYSLWNIAKPTKNSKSAVSNEENANNYKSATLLIEDIHVFWAGEDGNVAINNTSSHGENNVSTKKCRQ